MEKMKKPDFLGEINKEILEELTKHGRARNVAGLVGEVKELAEVTQICGLPFAGYLGKIEIPRPSGIKDEVAVAFEQDTPYKAAQGELDVLREFAPGSRLLITGKIQTLKDFETGKYLVFILADYVAASPKAEFQNDVAITGEIVFKPTHRETPRGKRISDIFIKVQKEFAPGSCFIPCICWQETADEVAGWEQGTKVRLLGRYQSREYDKEVATYYAGGKEAFRETERRTAYELSVQLIEKMEAGNEK